MKITRKDFLRLSGLSLLAFAGKRYVSTASALAGSPRAPQPGPGPLNVSAGAW